MEEAQGLFVVRVDGEERGKNKKNIGLLVIDLLCETVDNLC